MSNMSYCRFRNTLQDLNDCFEHIDDDVSDAEDKARRRLIDICREIADFYPDEYPENDPSIES